MDLYRWYADFSPASKGSVMLSQSKHWSGGHCACWTCSTAPDGSNMSLGRCAKSGSFIRDPCSVDRWTNLLVALETWDLCSWTQTSSSDSLWGSPYQSVLREKQSCCNQLSTTTHLCLPLLHFTEGLLPFRATSIHWQALVIICPCECSRSKKFAKWWKVLRGQMRRLVAIPSVMDCFHWQQFYKGCVLPMHDLSFQVLGQLSAPYYLQICKTYNTKNHLVVYLNWPFCQ